MMVDEKHVKAFVCDVTLGSDCPESLIAQVSPCSVDLISAIFVLSAIPSSKLSHAISNLFQVVKPGGIVLFRDYAYGDLAQVRFHTSDEKKLIEKNVYVRQDGTLSHFFEQGWFFL
jgi:methyltransferase-like protein 6